MTSSELERYYRILELEPGATLEQINQAYKDLVFVWHPDRLPKDNPRLQHKAQEKLKLFNEARDKLRSLRDNQPTRAYSPAPQANKPSSTYSYPPHTTYQQPQPNSDLSGKDFSRANLSNRDLSGRNLSYANLSGSNLSDTFMHKVILRGADLSEANLFRANLLLADLRDANLRSANLIGADLSGADLRGADLTGARIRSGDRLLVKLIGAKLAGAIMPDGIIHT
ncbi:MULTISPECIES: pentapeptide repeat-containing protein [Aphanizomenonaceae]|uniref:Pentapeptide repeat-containing protein n=1 Tax=Dolichospermum heterosporum TAC447 TaxID=747523 RepID=A0ABY5LYV9_9CYAN|nr:MULTISPECIES: pentapeptide repeat-containing protein [Aphanizomenonaceae]MBE9258714.1 pentapeptide repeat-containing protein [Dolichospermum sp. LEGE 00246]MTJ32884.1 molecular chaperone DnaJ [Aphanizomenon sp. UHCC 0183]QSV71598.1 MAG: DnaJ domain-containing protein [Aphanizomenon flos-aquae KM1D3_PB]UUO15840.1 pentapeptide repeat-containing protein [Dolichospermum heterosporum TAC447]